MSIAKSVIRCYSRTEELMMNPDQKVALAIRLVCGIPYVSTTESSSLVSFSLTQAIELV